MASPTSALDSRLPRHASSGPVHSAVTALQGATAAFNANPSSRARSPSIHYRSGASSTEPVGVSHRSPEMVPLRNIQTPELPESGSVKDKIGKFSAYQQQPSSLKDAFGKTPTSIGVNRARTPQQIAAQLAAGRSTPGEITATHTGVSRTQGSKPIPSKRSDDNEGPPLLAPKPVWATSTTTASLDKILRSEADLPIREKSVQRRPVAQISPIEAAKLAAKKPRPPPVPRKPAAGASGSTSVPINVHSKGPESPKQTSKNHSSRHLGDTTTPSKAPPALPPRTGASAVPRKDLTNHRRLLETNNGSRMRPSTPGTASLYTPSLSNSTTSLLDNSSGLDEGAFSDAVVASSRASVRASQERKVPPPPPPERRARSRSLKRLPHTAKGEHTDSSSPSTHLRQTLREPAKVAEDDEGYQRHKHLIRKHPHKHHEGDRRRWRSEITEKERRRYEGVWAANKGLLLPPEHLRVPEAYPPDSSEMVVNLVAADIWSRSRLPRHVLAQIWDLVDGQHIGLLTREEFVVGMWLIDQQLKGHKLPPRVPASVWGSVKRISGVHIHGLPPA
ncbi:increased rDNA silencing protein [Aspergillus brasiliensis]|uniref:Increased rDNA silencing protein n=1 Tax=Aspergillus brasiliensis TaxID=319629 RepID=A0A9W5YN70_9EURO|nr:increased rDNA silencing protein [Aspergillus brasiliensis]GKZ45554.1 increased rDNA silencing protein [Aspergillus brasiliensis]